MAMLASQAGVRAQMPQSRCRRSPVEVPRTKTQGQLDHPLGLTRQLGQCQRVRLWTPGQLSLVRQAVASVRRPPVRCLRRCCLRQAWLWKKCLRTSGGSRSGDGATRGRGTSCQQTPSAIGATAAARRQACCLVRMHHCCHADGPGALFEALCPDCLHVSDSTVHEAVSCQQSPATCPSGCQYPTSAKEIQLQAACRSSSWQLDVYGTPQAPRDADGWHHALDFRVLPFEGPTRSTALFACVRRRRWARTRIPAAWAEPMAPQRCQHVFSAVPQEPWRSLTLLERLSPRTQSPAASPLVSRGQTPAASPRARSAATSPVSSRHASRTSSPARRQSPLAAAAAHSHGATPARSAAQSPLVSPALASSALPEIPDGAGLDSDAAVAAALQMALPAVDSDAVESSPLATESNAAPEPDASSLAGAQDSEAVAAIGDVSNLLAHATLHNSINHLPSAAQGPPEAQYARPADTHGLQSQQSSDASVSDGARRSSVLPSLHDRQAVHHQDDTETLYAHGVGVHRAQEQRAGQLVSAAAKLLASTDDDQTSAASVMPGSTSDAAQPANMLQVHPSQSQVADDLACSAEEASSDALEQEGSSQGQASAKLSTACAGNQDAGMSAPAAAAAVESSLNLQGLRSASAPSDQEQPQPCSPLTADGAGVTKSSSVHSELTDEASCEGQPPATMAAQHGVQAEDDSDSAVAHSNGGAQDDMTLLQIYSKGMYG